MDKLDYTEEWEGEEYDTPKQLTFLYYWYRYIRPGCLTLLFLLIFTAIIAGMVLMGK